MKKPRALCVKDSWSDGNKWGSSGFIYTEIYNGDSGTCIRIDFQGDLQTKDVWFNAYDAERLGKALIKQAAYLRSKK